MSYSLWPHGLQHTRLHGPPQSPGICSNPCPLNQWCYLTISSSAGESNGNPLQYSCLENPMDRRAWWAAVHGVAKSRTRLSDFTFTFHFHALEKEMATHSSVLGLENPRDGGAWWASIYGVTQNRTRLKWLSSSSGSILTKYRSYSIGIKSICWQLPNLNIKLVS